MKIKPLTRKKAYIVVAAAALVLAGSTPVSSQDIPPERALNLDVRADSYVSFFNEAHELLQAGTLPDADGHYFLPKESPEQPEWWLTTQVIGNDPKRCAIKYYRSDNLYLVGVMNGDGTLWCTDDAATGNMFPLGCEPLGFSSAYSDLSGRVPGGEQDLSTLLKQQTLGRTDATWAAQILVEYGVTIHDPALAKKAFLIYAIMVSEALRFRPIGELVKQNWLGSPVLTEQQSRLIFVWKDMSVIFCRGDMGTRSPRQLGQAQMNSVDVISKTLDFVKGVNQCLKFRHEIPVPP